MRLNGWQRIGVLASVAWFVGAWIHVGSAQEQKYQAANSSYYHRCRSVGDYDPEHDREQQKACSDKAYAYARLVCCHEIVGVHEGFGVRTQDQFEAAVFPIPLGWLAAYVCI
jgi:hypothetical protein